jgi:DNA-binding transcriptional LysR family regulator
LRLIEILTAALKLYLHIDGRKKEDLNMELRVLEYFLAVARNESISKAAESLHLSQPTLSRQIRDLEEELGKQLLIRGNRRVTLTDEGRLLQKRAEEIVSLVNKTEKELSLSDEIIAGDVYIGAGETENMRYLARAALSLFSSSDKFNLRYAK